VVSRTSTVRVVHEIPSGTPPAGEAVGPAEVVRHHRDQLLSSDAWAGDGRDSVLRPERPHAPFSRRHTRHSRDRWAPSRCPSFARRQPRWGPRHTRCSCPRRTGPRAPSFRRTHSRRRCTFTIAPCEPWLAWWQPGKQRAPAEQRARATGLGHPCLRLEHVSGAVFMPSFWVPAGGRARARARTADPEARCELEDRSLATRYGDGVGREGFENP
jgi:hypothetical protein